MNQWLPALAGLFILGSALAQPVPEVAVGRIERLAPIASAFVDPRPVDVWLPADYSPAKRYKVLYMHDGQMLFDASTTWNRKAWRVDVVAARLLAAGSVRPFIVVGPWNNGRWRHAEFFPQGFLPHLQPEPLRQAFVDQALLGRPQSDAYLRFLVDELKPAIDARYATDPGREACFVMGSSMGGLISVYALCEHPQVFGAAAALSTHWIGSFERNTAIPDAALAYLRRRLPDPGRVRLYLDRGTADLDALYDVAQARVDALLADKGYRPPDFVSRVFDGQGHDEDAWQRRLDQPLAFLLGR